MAPIPVGQTFGLLTVESAAPQKPWQRARYVYCRCGCGNPELRRVRLSGLLDGHSTSCGCLHREQARENIRRLSTTHGYTGTSTYKIWEAMRQRCSNPKDGAYKHYGGRGIKVCLRWSEFENFLADMGERPAGMTLDREKNDEGYCKSNCRWVTMEVQANNRRGNRRLTFRGETLTMAEWTRKLGMPNSLLRKRLWRGWSIEDALTT